MNEPILFARIGWMTYYNGPQAGDERPKGRGKYNETGVGHEAFNFKTINGHLFGYFQPQMQAVWCPRVRMRSAELMFAMSMNRTVPRSRCHGL